MKYQHIEHEDCIIIKTPPIILSSLKSFIQYCFILSFLGWIIFLLIKTMVDGKLDAPITGGIFFLLLTSLWAAILTSVFERKDFIVTRTFIAVKKFDFVVIPLMIKSIEKKHIVQLLEEIVLEKDSDSDYTWKAYYYYVETTQEKHSFKKEEIQAISKIMNLRIVTEDKTKTN